MSFNLTVRLLAIGELSILIKAVGTNGELDAIVKYLLVKASVQDILGMGRYRIAY